MFMVFVSENNFINQNWRRYSSVCNVGWLFIEKILNMISSSKIFTQLFGEIHKTNLTVNSFIDIS